MLVKGRTFGRIAAIGRLVFALIAIGEVGCVAPGPSPPISSPLVSTAHGPVVVDSPRPDDDFSAVSPASSVETWVVHTRACEQVMGSNPWPAITVARFDDQGGPLLGTEPEALLNRMTGRPAVFLIHGAEYTYKDSIEEAVKVRAQLEALGGLPPETLFIVFDWPSERTLALISVDLNDKARRSRIAGYHLARFLQAVPPGSKVCLMGHSDGARVALTATDLLSGAELRPFMASPGAQLTSARSDLRIRIVALEAAVGHTWLNPGDRLGSALPNSEGLLSLRNSGDYALAVFVLGSYTGVHRPLGLVGLSPLDLKKLGPLKDRVEEINQHSLSGRSHTHFTESLTYPGVAERIVAYTSWRDISSGAGQRYSTRDLR
jgi:hypothetical protein